VFRNNLAISQGIKKTVVIFQRTASNPNAPDPRVTVDGYDLKVVKKFKYLGGQLTGSSKIEVEINFRIQRASASFSQLQVSKSLEETTHFAQTKRSNI
jgi:hypothetical protein